MSSTAVIFSPLYYRHNPGRDHPESAQRLSAIIKELTREPSKNRNWQFVQPEKASLQDVELVHGLEYIKLVEAICRSGGGHVDLEDTVVSRESYDVALYAVGGALQAVNFVMKRRFENAFALIRPPGHHASKFRALGFCLFNNVAAAAEHLLRRHKIGRILVLDIDDHHGNGTQETFYRTDKVLYVSLHEDPKYGFPGTGFADEVGKDEGSGYNVNIPLPYGTGDQVYLNALREIVIPITRQYKPQFMLVSAGFDGFHSDPIGSLSLSMQCYEQICEIIVNLASEVCEGRLVSVLEGGYDVRHVGKLAANFITRMSMGPTAQNSKSQMLRFRQHARPLSNKILKEVKEIQKAFWDLN